MLKEIFNDLKVHLKTNIPEFADDPAGRKKVGRYHGEFEEGFDWVPVLPVALLLIENNRPQSLLSDSSSTATITMVSIYVADKIDSLQLAEDVANSLDGLGLSIDGIEYTSIYRSLVFHGYIKQVEIYKINIEVK
jgi:hypothetical protein